MINIGHLITEDIIKSHAIYICKDSNIKSRLESIESKIDSNNIKETINGKDKIVKFESQLKGIVGEILKDIESLNQIEMIGVLEYQKRERNRENIFIAEPKYLETRLKSFEENYPDIIEILKNPTVGNQCSKEKDKKSLSEIFLDCFGYADFSSESFKYDNYITFIKRLGQPAGRFYKELKAKKSAKKGNSKYTREELDLFLIEIENEFKNYNYSVEIERQNDKMLKSIRENVDLDAGIGAFKEEIRRVIDKNIGKCEELNNNIDIGIHNYISISNKNQKWSAYMYLFKLGIKTCPYCNRQYITPIYSESNGRVRADLDHFYSKSKFPFFSMSLCNLVPSCKSCNSSLKGTSEFTYDKYLNPYERGFENLLKFDYKFNGIDFLKADGRIEVNLKSMCSADENLVENAENNVKCFKLDSLYSYYHSDEVKDMIVRRYTYSNEMLDEIKSELEKLLGRTGSKDEYLKFIFGNYSIEENFHEKPLSKLHKDIVDGLIERKVNTKKLKVRTDEKQKLKSFAEKEQ